MLLHQEQRQVNTQRIDPKLIMANTILQQSTVELVQHIENELLENPALDVIEDESPCDGRCLDLASCPYCSQHNLQMYRYDNSIDIAPEVLQEADIEVDADYDPLGNLEAELTLSDHLRGLLRSTTHGDEYVIGEYLINCLDANGYLDMPVDEIAIELGVGEDEVLKALKLIHGFDPPGVGARDLRECMLIQLKFLREEGQGNPLAERMIRLHFDDVVNRRYTKLARAVATNIENVKAALDFIRLQLNPYPAGQFRAPWSYKVAETRSAIRPDVVIRRTETGYEVDVVGTDAMLLGVTPHYREAYNRIKAAKGQVPDDERRHVIEYVERAELFIKNINQRRKTLRLITRSIIEMQQGFLETGSRSFLRPLTRTRIAEKLGMHESTISRATSQKFVQLPNQEVIAFDIFFNPSLSIKTMIEAMIESEDPNKPLSDRRIVELLKEQGIDLARRTVVKYRSAQKLLSSNRRRR